MSVALEETVTIEETVAIAEEQDEIVVVVEQPMVQVVTVGATGPQGPQGPPGVVTTSDAEHAITAGDLTGSDAAAIQKGHLQLAGDLGGTAALPTVLGVTQIREPVPRLIVNGLSDAKSDAAEFRGSLFQPYATVQQALKEAHGGAARSSLIGDIGGNWQVEIEIAAGPSLVFPNLDKKGRLPWPGYAADTVFPGQAHKLTEADPLYRTVPSYGRFVGHGGTPLNGDQDAGGNPVYNTLIYGYFPDDYVLYLGNDDPETSKGAAGTIPENFMVLGLGRKGVDAGPTSGIYSSLERPGTLAALVHASLCSAWGWTVNKQHYDASVLLICSTGFCGQWSAFDPPNFPPGDGVPITDTDATGGAHNWTLKVTAPGTDLVTGDRAVIYNASDGPFAGVWTPVTVVGDVVTLPGIYNEIAPPNLGDGGYITKVPEKNRPYGGFQFGVGSMPNQLIVIGGADRNNFGCERQYSSGGGTAGGATQLISRRSGTGGILNYSSSAIRESGYTEDDSMGNGWPVYYATTPDDGTSDAPGDWVNGWDIDGPGRFHNFSDWASGQGVIDSLAGHARIRCIAGLDEGGDLANPYTGFDARMVGMTIHIGGGGTFTGGVKDAIITSVPDVTTCICDLDVATGAGTSIGWSIEQPPIGPHGPWFRAAWECHFRETVKMIIASADGQLTPEHPFVMCDPDWTHSIKIAVPHWVNDPSNEPVTIGSGSDRSRFGDMGNDTNVLMILDDQADG